MQPDPDNLPRARALGLLVFAMAGVGLLTGKAYFRGVVERDAAPVDFWVTVASQLALGAFCVIGSLVA